MKVSEIYRKGEDYLNTERVSQLGLWDTPMKIIGVDTVNLRGRDKLVIRLQRPNSPQYVQLPLNRTNAQILSEAWGDDAEAWVGKTLKLRKTKRAFQGKLVDAVEVAPLVEGGEASRPS